MIILRRVRKFLQGMSECGLLEKLENIDLYK